MIFRIKHGKSSSSEDLLEKSGFPCSFSIFTNFGCPDRQEIPWKTEAFSPETLVLGCNLSLPCLRQTLPQCRFCYVWYLFWLFFYLYINVLIIIYVYIDHIFSSYYFSYISWSFIIVLYFLITEIRFPDFNFTGDVFFKRKHLHHMILVLFVTFLASSRWFEMGFFLYLFIVKDSAIFLTIGILKLTRFIMIDRIFLLGLFIFMTRWMYIEGWWKHARDIQRPAFISDYLFEGPWSDDPCLPSGWVFILLGVLPEPKCTVHRRRLEKNSATSKGIDRTGFFSRAFPRIPH